MRPAGQCVLWTEGTRARRLFGKDRRRRRGDAASGTGTHGFQGAV